MQNLVDEQHRRMLTGHAPDADEAETAETPEVAVTASAGELILQPKTFPLLFASSSSGGANTYVPVEVGEIPKFSELKLTRVRGGGGGTYGDEAILLLLLLLLLLGSSSDSRLFVGQGMDVRSSLLFRHSLATTTE